MYYQIKPNLARIKHNYKNYFKADKDSSIWKGAERDPVATKRILEHLDVNNSKELRQNHGLKPYLNPLWNILNPHR